MKPTRILLLLSASSVFLLTRCGDDDKSSQIDRMGRAAVNTALIGAFLDPGSGGERGAFQDQYNRTPGPPERWVNRFAGEMAGNLAIYDALDASCGNQLLAGPTATPGRYDAFAGILADDRLWVNTNSGSCQAYLAVEANALGITNSECGGRTPLNDTIDVTYSVVAIGATSGVDDGVPSDGDGTASLNDFPFYAPPLPGP